MPKTSRKKTSKKKHSNRKSSRSPRRYRSTDLLELLDWESKIKKRIENASTTEQLEALHQQLADVGGRIQAALKASQQPSTTSSASIESPPGWIPESLDIPGHRIEQAGLFKIWTQLQQLKSNYDLRNAQVAKERDVIAIKQLQEQLQALTEEETKLKARVPSKQEKIEAQMQDIQVQLMSIVDDKFQQATSKVLREQYKALEKELKELKATK